MPCFLQKNGVLMNEEVLRIEDSCFRSAWVYEKCLQSLLRLVLTGNQSWISFAMFLLFEVRKLKLGYRPVPSP